MNDTKNVLGVALLAVVIAVGSYLSLHGQIASLQQAIAPADEIGALTPGSRFPHGVSIGLPTSSPSNLALIKVGTCSILANASIAATSTANFDCSFTGVVAGDTVLVTQAASSTLASQYVIKGAVASTTADTITFSILNLTGAAATPAATVGFGSSTVVAILRAQ